MADAKASKTTVAPVRSSTHLSIHLSGLPHSSNLSSVPHLYQHPLLPSCSESDDCQATCLKQKIIVNNKLKFPKDVKQ